MKIAEFHQQTAIIADSRLREKHAGSLSGRKHSEAACIVAATIKKDESKRTYRPPGAFLFYTSICWFATTYHVRIFIQVMESLGKMSTREPNLSLKISRKLILTFRRKPPMPCHTFWWLLMLGLSRNSYPMLSRSVALLTCSTQASQRFLSTVWATPISYGRTKCLIWAISWRRRLLRAPPQMKRG